MKTRIYNAKNMLQVRAFRKKHIEILNQPAHCPRPEILSFISVKIGCQCFSFGIVTNIVKQWTSAAYRTATNIYKDPKILLEKNSQALVVFLKQQRYLTVTS